jgi:hypothetical protein
MFILILSISGNTEDNEDERIKQLHVNKKDDEYKGEDDEDLN